MMSHCAGPPEAACSRASASPAFEPKFTLIPVCCSNGTPKVFIRYSLITPPSAATFTVTGSAARARPAAAAASAVAPVISLRRGSHCGEPSGAPAILHLIRMLPTARLASSMPWPWDFLGTAIAYLAWHAERFPVVAGRDLTHGCLRPSSAARLVAAASGIALRGPGLPATGHHAPAQHG